MEKNRLKILFVEDSQDDVELALRHLQRENLDIDWKRVDCEKDLIAVLRNWQPDIILSDHSMPSFNGLEALEIVKRLAPEVPLIFVSGTIGEERAIESIHMGAVDYVLKDNLLRLGTAVSNAVENALERRRAMEMERERSRLIAILESTSDLVLIADPDGSILYLNQGARSILNLGNDISQLGIKNLYASWAWDSVNYELRSTVMENGIWQGEAVLAAADGTEIPASQVIISHKDDFGMVEFFSIIARDLRERRAYEERIQFLANFNALTEMPNRSLLADRTAQAISHGQWSHRTIGLMIINIDGFKLINDGYGRETGDETLKQFSRRIRDSVRGRDTVAHLEADSFAILATDLSAPEDVINVVRKIQQNLQEPFSIGDRNLTITAGIGVSLFPRDGSDFNTLFRNTDAALHRAKEKGDGSFQFYASEMTENAALRIDLENDLYLALARQQLELHYQPQVSFTDGRIIGVEALMRWNHPVRGVVSPLEFIPVAEKSDLILSMGEWALFEACSQVRSWQQSGVGKLRVSVNVSARQFRDQNFPDTVARVLKKTKLDPELLELELTESALIQDYMDAARILGRLNNLGVKIALDDFGTGYSNLSYLSRLPLHCMKVDKSFVQNFLNDANDGEIVRAIISLARAMNLHVIGEGVEKEEQMAFLQGLGCNEGQGFLFSRPLPAEDIHTLLSADPYHLYPFFKKSTLIHTGKGNPDV